MNFTLNSKVTHVFVYRKKMLKLHRFRNTYIFDVGCTGHNALGLRAFSFAQRTFRLQVSRLFRFRYLLGSFQSRRDLCDQPVNLLPTKSKQIPVKTCPCRRLQPARKYSRVLDRKRSREDDGRDRIGFPD